jgi:hypothetical protein
MLNSNQDGQGIAWQPSHKKKCRTIKYSPEHWRVPRPMPTYFRQPPLLSIKHALDFIFHETKTLKNNSEAMNEWPHDWNAVPQHVRVIWRERGETALTEERESENRAEVDATERRKNSPAKICMHAHVSPVTVTTRADSRHGIEAAYLKRFK